MAIETNNGPRDSFCRYQNEEGCQRGGTSPVPETQLQCERASATCGHENVSHFLQNETRSRRQARGAVGSAPCPGKIPLRRPNFGRTKCRAQDGTDSRPANPIPLGPASAAPLACDTHPHNSPKTAVRWLSLLVPLIYMVKGIPPEERVSVW